MCRSILILLVVLNGECGWCSAELRPSDVWTTSGRISGRLAYSFVDRKPFVEYRGIPYAEPPIGPLRFRAPVPSRQHWNATRQCVDHGPVCLQTNRTDGTVIGSEDCLRLNVYAPLLSAQTLPVMVYIHGGAFYWGSGDSNVFGAEFLMDEPVILVTLNYRLGVLGFLALDDKERSGNQGLKDQQLALQWVRENIRAFGGNAELVTLFGQSAGSLAAQLHMFAAGSRPLFKRSIQMSTAFDGRNVFRDRDPETMAKLRTFLSDNDIQVNSTGQLIHEMQHIDGERIVMALPYTQFEVSVALPTVEPETAYRPFITGTPDKYALEQASDLPFDILTGFTSNEGISQLDNLPKFLENFHVDLPTIRFDRDYTSPGYRQAAASIRKQYFPTGFTHSSSAEFARLMTDAYQHVPIDAKVRQLANCSTGRTFYYVFNGDTQLNAKKRSRPTADAGQLDGAAHFDDVCYLFYCGREYAAMDDCLKRGAEALNLVRRMVRIFVQFAANGELPWRAVEPGKMHYFDIAGNVEGVDPLTEVRRFWNGILELYVPELK